MNRIPLRWVLRLALSSRHSWRRLGQPRSVLDVKSKNLGFVISITIQTNHNREVFVLLLGAQRADGKRKRKITIPKDLTGTRGGKNVITGTGSY